MVRQRRELFVLPSARLVLLDGAGLGDEHAEELADYLRDNSQTELLHLAANELTDDGVLTLSSTLPTCAVRRLSLAGNNVQDEGARALAAALAYGYAPRHLDLSDNMLTDGGAIDLVRSAAAHTPSLVWLDLRANPLLTAEGKIEAADAAREASFEMLV